MPTSHAPNRRPDSRNEPAIPDATATKNDDTFASGLRAHASSATPRSTPYSAVNATLWRRWIASESSMNEMIVNGRLNAIPPTPRVPATIRNAVPLPRRSPVLLCSVERSISAPSSVAFGDRRDRDPADDRRSFTHRGTNLDLPVEGGESVRDPLQ